MSNVHGLFSNNDNKDDHDDDDDKNDDENNRYVGGIGDRGGGSGLAVQPNPDLEGTAATPQQRDSLFRLAQNATSEDQAQVRRTITMYRDGFVVDDGPYRRLDDPSNAEFLRALAAGRTPRELLDQATAEGSTVTVGLVDKRNEEYVETFRSFSGQGTALGGGVSATAAATTSDSSIFDPSVLSSRPMPEQAAASGTSSTTSIQVRLPSGQRRVVRVDLSQTVLDLATLLRDEAGGTAFRLVAGFPPKPLDDPNATVQDAGLKGAQVSLQKAA